jgi:hypothetical protein
MNRHHGITHPEVSVQQNSTPCVMVFVFFNGLARDFCVDFFGKRLQILLAAFLCASFFGEPFVPSFHEEREKIVQ